ncbi:MAG: DOMON-like domain-containing protein [Hydrogenophaga sp.]|nr:DOMON-like domain-containing protein [Hydrogenophaga sp.]
MPRPTLQLRYELQGDLARLRVPAPSSEEVADGLWQHTCFEAFVMPTQAGSYQEFNFSPSGQWASYRFRAERVRDLAAEVSQQLGTRTQRPQLRLEHQGDRLVLHATLAREALPGASPDGLLRLGLSAVVEDSAGQLSYWALHHPAARPDFHHPGSFVHTLPWPFLP